MLQRIDTEILTPRGRIVDICNIDMFDNNNSEVCDRTIKPTHTLVGEVLG